MKRLHTFSRLAAAVCACLVASLSTAHAADQTLIMRPNADETCMTVFWGPPSNDFGPRPSCQMPNPLTPHHQHSYYCTRMLDTHRECCD
jgi:hypothetical protein